MKTRVLDSWPVLEWIQGRNPSATAMDEMLSDAEAAKTQLRMSAMNAGEVYYFLRKHHSSDLAESWRESCQTLPVTIETPNMEEIWSAAVLKGQFKISYADAFAAALAMKYNCPLVTGDPEFRSVRGLSVEWVGE